MGWEGRSLNLDPPKMSPPDFENFPCHEIKLSRSEIWNLCRSSRYLDHIKIGRADFDLFFLHFRHFMDTDFDHLIISIIFSFTVRFRIFKNIFRVRYTLNWTDVQSDVSVCVSSIMCEIENDFGESICGVKNFSSVV